MLKKLKFSDNQKTVLVIIARFAVPVAAIVVTDVVAKKLNSKNV